MIRVSIISILKLYQATRPLRTPSCRFFPSCSRYAAQSMERFGVIKGLVLTSWRVLRCHPLCAGGVDEVPAHFCVFKRSLP